MAYVNKYREGIVLTQGATAATLALPDGEYRLTLTGDADESFEIVDALVTGGSAVLSRGLEGTVNQDWPEGSVIFCAVTAGQLNGMMVRMAELESRLDALEGGGSLPDGALTDSSGNVLTDTTGNTLTTGA